MKTSPTELIGLQKKQMPSIDHVELDLKPYIERLIILDALPKEKGNIYLLFDNQKLDFLFISPSVGDFAGYSYEEVSERRMGLIEEILQFEGNQNNFFKDYFEWSSSTRHALPIAAMQNSFLIRIVGLKMRHASGRTITVMVNGYPFFVDNTGSFAYSYIQVKDITHLWKGECYWAYAEAKDETGTYLSTLNSSVLNPLTNGFLSPRETEILTLISHGYDTKEIAAQLFISVNTVEKHRKNMIARLGARDTVALCELARRCSLI